MNAPDKVNARLLSRDAEDVWYDKELDAQEVVNLQCGPCLIPLSLDDLYEDTGLLDP